MFKRKVFRRDSLGGQKGYTLAEILTTVVILAVVAGIAIPNFSKSTDKAQADNAIAQLRNIRVAEKIYFAREGEFVACGNETQIRSLLGAEINKGNYSFSVTIPAPPAAPTTFLATATGKLTITVDQDCHWTGVTPSPTC